jgi:hypothetical protein
MNKLTTYASLIGVIGAIGGGFYAWGEFNTRLMVIENRAGVNITPLTERISLLEVDLIDRIDALREKVEEGNDVDLSVLSSQITGLDSTLSSQITSLDATLSNKITGIDETLTEQIDKLEANIKADLDAMKVTLTKVDKEASIALKENELQDEKIEAVRLKATNPLAS